MSGQLCAGLVVLDCDVELDWLPVDVDVVVVLVAAKAIPTEDSAATTEIARTEYASKLLFFPPKPGLKLIFPFTSRTPQAARQ
jgi:hypothetical protein